MSDTPALEVRGLRKVFGDGDGATTALGGATLELAENEFATLIGTSGCGKSTLLSIVAGLEEPTEGEVEVAGSLVRGPGRDRGMVFQAYTLFPWLRVSENVEFALRDEGLSRQDQKARAQQYLDLVGLVDFSSAYPHELSGGMRQRVALARALCYQPRVLLMDEPFGALDALTRQLMQELLMEVWEQHRLTVLFVTHDIDEAVFLSDRVLVMSTRPGVIKEIRDIDLPRPRTFEVLATPEFAQHRLGLLASVREESLKAVGSAANELREALEA